MYVARIDDALVDLQSPDRQTSQLVGRGRKEGIGVEEGIPIPSATVSFASFLSTVKTCKPKIRVRLILMLHHLHPQAHRALSGLLVSPPETTIRLLVRFFMPHGIGWGGTALTLFDLFAMQGVYEWLS